ncbi:exported protein of unknown function [Paraburkholderia kururiensis]
MMSAWGVLVSVWALFTAPVTALPVTASARTAVAAHPCATTSDAAHANPRRLVRRLLLSIRYPESICKFSGRRG